MHRSSTADPPRWPLESQPTRRPRSSRRPSTLNFLVPLLTAKSMASLWFGDPGGGIATCAARSSGFEPSSFRCQRALRSRSAVRRAPSASFLARTYLRPCHTQRHRRCRNPSRRNESRCQGFRHQVRWGLRRTVLLITVLLFPVLLITALLAAAAVTAVIPNWLRFHCRPNQPTAAGSVARCRY